MNEGDEDLYKEEDYEEDDQLQDEEASQNSFEDQQDSPSGGKVAAAAGAAKSIKEKGVKGAATDAVKSKAKDFVPGSEKAVEAASKASSVAAAASSIGAMGTKVLVAGKAVIASFATPIPYIILIVAGLVLQFGVVVFVTFAGYQAFGQNEAACGPGASNISVDMSGDWLENGNQVANYLTTTPFESMGGKPMTPKQAAAFVGNFKEESGVTSNTPQGSPPWTSPDSPNSTIISASGSGKAVGFAQWDGVRRTALAKFAEENGKHWSDPHTQLEFLKHEIDSSEGARLVGAGFNDGTKTVKQLAYLVTSEYERPGKAASGKFLFEEERQQAAEAFLGQYKGGSYDAVAAGGVGGNCTNSGGSSMGSGQFIHPLPGATVTSKFGMRLHPVLGTSKMHNGVDYSKGCGSEVLASDSGTVTFSDYKRASGYRIDIDHGNGFSTGYFHLNSKLLVNEGDTVSQGDVIGYEDTTGRSTGCHLHFEVRENGNHVDPQLHVTE